MRVALAYEFFGERAWRDRRNVLVARHLLERGHEVHVYCDERGRTTDVAGVVFHDVRAACFGATDRIREPIEISSFAVRASRLLRRDRHLYDVVDVLGHAAYEHDVITTDEVVSVAAHAWAEEAGAHYRAAHLRGAVAPVVRPRIAVLRAIERHQFRAGGYERVIAETPRAAADLARVHAVPADRIAMIPIPVTIPPAGESKPDCRSGAVPTILFVGHEFERKGLEEAIRALALVTSSADLVVLGNGDRGRYEQLARTLRVDERITFAGGTTTPDDFFASADLLLFPSRHESWGRPVIEAMAFGIPVVTGRAVGAAVEVIDADAGIVLDQTDPQTIASALETLLRNPQMRKTMGENGRAAAARFTLEAAMTATTAVYETVA